MTEKARTVNCVNNADDEGRVGGVSEGSKMKVVINSIKVVKVKPG